VSRYHPEVDAGTSPTSTLYAVLSLVALAGCDQVFGLDRHADAGPDAPSGPIAHLTMDMVAGNTVADDSGHGHDGTCTDCPTLVTGSPRNTALSFTGVQRIEITAGGELETPTALSVTAWIRVRVVPTGFGCPYSKRLGPADDNSWELCVAPSLHLNLWTSRGATLVPTEVLELGRWYHTAFTWDGALKTLYLDGARISSGEGMIDFDGGTIELGAETDSGTVSVVFPGEIDDVSIYDRVLDAASIAALAAP
jgi:hypothetical protein